MDSVLCSIQGNHLIVGSKPFLMCGAEIQYFRMPVDDWRDRLEKAKKGGVNTVSSYMPWYWHEPEDGLFDFSGRTDPSRDLRLFFEMTRSLDLKVIARPGPFVNSELRLGGLPEWLFNNYPETLSRRGDGRIASGRPVPAEGGSKYREMVRRWYEQVVPVIADYDIHNGGTVIMFQPDNELSAAWSYGMLNSLYDQEIIKEHWPAWLEKQYGEIGQLNTVYRTDYVGFSDVPPPVSLVSGDAPKTPALDWMSFKRDFFGDWGCEMAKWAMELGMKAPILFNEPIAGFYGHGDHAGFGNNLKKHGICGVTAIHTYSDRIFDLEGIQNVILGIKLLKSSPLQGPAISVEANTGWYMPRLSRSDINFAPLMRLGFAHGLSGTVIYPYTACHINMKDVIEGPEYWQPACLDLEGTPTRLYHDFHDFSRFLHSWQTEIARTEPVSEVSLAYTPCTKLIDFVGAYRLDLPGNAIEPGAFDGAGGDSFDAEPVLTREGASGHDWLDGYEGVSKQTIKPESGLLRKTKEMLLLLTRMNCSFGMLELTASNREPGDGWIIVISNGTLEEDAISYLVKHLELGGGCVFAPTVPVYNQHGKQDGRLADLLGVELAELVRPAGGAVMDYGCRCLGYGKDNVLGVNDWIYFHNFAAEHRVLAEYNGRTVAARISCDGVKAVVVGFPPMFTNWSSLDFWSGVFKEEMQLSPFIECHGNYCHAALQRGDETSFLTVFNLGSSGESELIVRNPVDCIEMLTIPLDLALHEARCLVINAEFMGRRIVYSTSEITRDNSENQLYLNGAPGTQGEIVFSEDMSVRLDGTEQTLLNYSSGAILRYEHGSAPVLLEAAI